MKRKNRGEEGGRSTLSEKVSSVRVMTSAPDRTARDMRMARDTTTRRIERRPLRRGVDGSMAGTDSGRGDGNGEERGKGEAGCRSGQTVREDESMLLLGWFGPGQMGLIGMLFFFI